MRSFLTSPYVSNISFSSHFCPLKLQSLLPFPLLFGELESFFFFKERARESVQMSIVNINTWFSLKNDLFKPQLRGFVYAS